MRIFNKFKPFRKHNFLPEDFYFQRKNKKTFIIHHYCPHTYNAGDHFVILSIRKHLKRHLPDSVFVPKAIAGNRGWGKPIGLRGINIYRSNQNADAVIVGGSDQYNKWSPRIREKEIRFLKPPMFLIGLGVSSRDINTPPYLNIENYRQDILATNNHACLSSVRDSITQSFLAELGCSKVINTGCPALYLFDKDFHTAKGLKKICLTFPYPLLHSGEKRDGSPPRKYSILKNTIKELVEFIKNRDMKPVIVCHDDRDVTRAQRLFPELEIFFSNYPMDYTEIYSQAAMVIGSRLHASIFNAALGVPFLNINLDLRGRGFSEDFGLTEWNIDYNDPDLSMLLKERINQVLAGDIGPLKKLTGIKREKFEIFDNFIRETAEKIKNPDTL